MLTLLLAFALGLPAEQDASAQKLFEAGNYDGVIQKAQQEREGRSNSPETTFFASQAFVRKEQPDQAREEFGRGVDAAQLEDLVAHRGLDQHRQVAPRRHRDAHLAHGDAENLLAQFGKRQPLGRVALAGRGAREMRDQAQLHLPAHRGLAEDGADIEQAQAAHFDKVHEHRRAASLERAGRNARDLHDVVGDQAVAAADELQPELALADA